MKNRLNRDWQGLISYKYSDYTEKLRRRYSLQEEHSSYIIFNVTQC